jgi:transposase-like protein
MSDEKKPDPRHETMLAALREGMTWEEAADKVGVSDRTLYRWCAADEELAAAAAKAKSGADDLVEAVTFRNCIDPDPAHNTLRMFWLKSRRPEVYRDTTRQVIEDARKSYETANSPETL